MAKPEAVATNDVEQKLEALRLRKQELELKKLEREVAQMEASDQDKIEARAKTEEELRLARESAKARQAKCNHRQGGTGLEGLHGKGQSPNYAVSKHTYPWGETRVLCLRCDKEWRPGDAGYEEALNYPTENQPSGGAVWTNIPKERIAALRNLNQ